MEEFWSKLLGPVLITGGAYLAYVFAKLLNGLNRFRQKKETAKELLNIKYAFKKDIFWESIVDTLIDGFVMSGLSLLASSLLIAGFNFDSISASSPAIILIGMTVSLWTETLASLKSDGNISDQEMQNLKKVYDDSKIEEKSENLIKDFIELTKTKKEVVEENKKFEELGNKGTYYHVPIDSYSSFRNTVLGKVYDVDGYYGGQCWDGCALLWQQLGKTLSTGGTGAAKGCWLNARDYNKGTDFDLIYNFNDLKVGDVVVFNSGIYGHIAFVDSLNPFRILGQNQTGTGNGSPFNIINASANGFLGAFRYKKWNNNNSNNNSNSNPLRIASTKDLEDIWLGKYGNNPIRRQNLINAGIDPDNAQDRINKGEGKPNSAPTQRTYTVKPGDNLWNIAISFYNDGIKYKQIYEANKSTIGDNPNLIRPGMVLIIP